MSKRGIALAAGLVLTCLLVAALVVRQPRSNGFTAELVRDRGGSVFFPITVHVKGQNVRRERAIALETKRVPIVGLTFDAVQGTMVEILNARAGKRWVIDPAQKTYYEENISAVDLPLAAEIMKSSFGMLGDREGRLLGTERAGGYLCEKIVTSDGSTTRWHSPKLDFDIKREFELDPTSPAETEEYRIRECDLPDSLFELPRGYRKVAVSTVP